MREKESSLLTIYWSESQVTAEFMGDFEATVDVSLEHYSMIEGSALSWYEPV